MAASVENLMYRIDVCKEFIGFWEQLFNIMQGVGDDDYLTDLEEQTFLELKGKIARTRYNLAQSLGKDFSGGNKILAVLNNAVDFEALREMTHVQRNRLETDWHQIFINLNKCLGILQARAPQTAKS
jgi:hypothetical protein